MFEEISDEERAEIKAQTKQYVDQDLWDKLLIKGWFLNEDLIWTVRKYAREVGVPNIATLLDIAYIFLYSGMRRAKNCKSSIYFKMPVRAFINNSAPVLSEALFSRKFSEEEIINALPAYRWVVFKNPHRVRKNHKQEEKKILGGGRAIFTIRSRDLTSTNWDKVS